MIRLVNSRSLAKSHGDYVSNYDYNRLFRGVIIRDMMSCAHFSLLQSMERLLCRLIITIVTIVGTNRPLCVTTDHSYSPWNSFDKCSF